jgi:DNA-binding MarR family transcriptional regulator
MIRHPKGEIDVTRIDLLFNSVVTRFFAIPTRQAPDGLMTFAQMRVLWAIDSLPGSPLRDVARQIGISNPTATELIDRLEREGFVKRERSTKDRRQVVLTLKARGHERMAEFARRRRERFAKLLKVIDRRDVATMAESLDRLDRILRKWRGGV